MMDPHKAAVLVATTESIARSLLRLATAQERLAVAAEDSNHLESQRFAAETKMRDES